MNTNGREDFVLRSNQPVSPGRSQGERIKHVRPRVLQRCRLVPSARSIRCAGSKSKAESGSQSQSESRFRSRSWCISALFLS